jgi:hypothetical protein
MSAGRRTLTVKLARKGDALLRAFELTAPTPGGDAWTTVDPTVHADLDSLARLLDEGELSAIEARLGDEGSPPVGPLLFDALFGDNAALDRILATLFARPEAPSPSPSHEPVRVRMLSRDSALLGLPWRLCTLAGALLTTQGWTFEVTAEEALRAPLSQPWNRVQVFARGMQSPEHIPSTMLARPALPALFNVVVSAIERPLLTSIRPRILVIAPQLSDEPSLSAADAVRSLRGQLAAIGVAHDDPTRLLVVQRPLDLREAVRALRPEFVFFHGDIDTEGARVRLLLVGADGKRSPLFLSDLVQWCPSPAPLAVFLSASFQSATAFYSALSTLGRWAPTVIASRTRASSAETPQTLTAWLCAWLSSEGDPVASLHADADSASLVRSTAALHTVFDRWTNHDVPAVPSAFELARRTAGDDARAAAMAGAARAVKSAESRVLALIAPAADPILGEPGMRPFADEIRLAGRHLGRLRTLTIPCPERRDDQPRPFLDAVLEALDASRFATLGEALRDAAALSPRPEEPGDPPVRGDDQTLLRLDFGAFGPAPRTPLTSADLSAYLDVAAEVLAPHCPASIRLITFLSLVMDPALTSSFNSWFSDKLTELASPLFEALLLPPLRRLDREAVRSAIVEAGPLQCPDPLVESMTDRLDAETGGELGAMLTQLAQAQAKGWPELLREGSVENEAWDATTDVIF